MPTDRPQIFLTCDSKHTYIFFLPNSLKQQYVGRQVAPLRHITSQPVFALSPELRMLSGEATNTNFIVFGLTRLGLEPTIYRTQGKHANHYTTDAVNKHTKTCAINKIQQELQLYICLQLNIDRFSYIHDKNFTSLYYSA